MNRGGRSFFCPQPITNNDVLSGRGVNIAQHAGNERFRALIQARYDVEYCTSYTTSEKRALAEEVISHIKSLQPPGRFLKRPKNHTKQGTGLDGPWEELSLEETIKKTCQALRDCSRKDRVGYGASVAVPEDVVVSTKARSQTGMTNKQLAELAAKEAIIKSESTGGLLGSVQTASVSAFGPFNPLPLSAAPPATQAPPVTQAPPTTHDGESSGLKRKAEFPPWYHRSTTPPVYEPAPKHSKTIPEITPSSPGGLSNTDFASTDQLLSTYAAIPNGEPGNPFSDDELVDGLDQKPQANEGFLLDTFDGHEILPGVIQDSPSSSPFSEHHAHFPED